MKKKRTVLKILILTILLQFIMFINISQAVSLSGIIDSGDEFLETGKSGASDTSTTASDLTTRGIINDIYSILFPLGVAVTVIVGGVIGIKFMIASAEDKAKIKESMIPYVIGCAVIYGAFGIWRITIEILSAI